MLSLDACATRIERRPNLQPPPDWATAFLPSHAAFLPRPGTIWRRHSIPYAIFLILLLSSPASCSPHILLCASFQRRLIQSSYYCIASFDRLQPPGSCLIAPRRPEDFQIAAVITPCCPPNIHTERSLALWSSSRLCGCAKFASPLGPGQHGCNTFYEDNCADSVITTPWWQIRHLPRDTKDNTHFARCSDTPSSCRRTQPETSRLNKQETDRKSLKRTPALPALFNTHFSPQNSQEEHRHTRP